MKGCAHTIFNNHFVLKIRTFGFYTVLPLSITHCWMLNLKGIIHTNETNHQTLFPIGYGSWYWVFLNLVHPSILPTWEGRTSHQNLHTGREKSWDNTLPGSIKILYLAYRRATLSMLLITRPSWIPGTPELDSIPLFKCVLSKSLET